MTLGCAYLYGDCCLFNPLETGHARISCSVKVFSHFSASCFLLPLLQLSILQASNRVERLKDSQGQVWDATSSDFWILWAIDIHRLSLNWRRNYFLLILVPRLAKKKSTGKIWVMIAVYASISYSSTMQCVGFLITSIPSHNFRSRLTHTQKKGRWLPASHILSFLSSILFFVP